LKTFDSFPIDDLAYDYAFSVSLRYESSWEIIDAPTGNVVMSDGLFEGQGQAYRASKCVPIDSCYTLIVHDTFGDGLGGTGGYSVTMDGTAAIISTSGAFQGQWMNHNINCVEDETNSSEGSDGGSSSTTMSRHRTCPTELVLDIVVVTDSPMSSTSFYLVDVDSGVFLWNESDLPPNESLHYSKCLEPGTCVNLVILDNDGAVSGDGSLLLKYAGEEVHTGRSGHGGSAYSFEC
jgi:hypothetical protein